VVAAAQAVATATVAARRLTLSSARLDTDIRRPVGWVRWVRNREAQPRGAAEAQMNLARPVDQTLGLAGRHRRHPASPASLAGWNRPWSCILRTIAKTIAHLLFLVMVAGKADKRQQQQISRS